MITSINLVRLLKPRSIAIIGASEKPGALGASLLSNIERVGYDGAIHLINPNRETIGGRPCLRAIADLPENVDVAVIAVPRTAVVEAMRALAARGVGAAIIFSAGFAEAGAEGMADQREIARIAEASGMIVEGPNCLGLMNFIDGIPLSFVELPNTPLADRPGVAILSQSGAMAVVLAVNLHSQDVGVSYSISTGNEAASGVEDYIDTLIDDPQTRVIAMVVEQFRKPERFLVAAARARAAGKHIVLLHPGQSSAARESAATHTGAMTGDYDVMALKVRRAGVLVVDTLEGLGDVTELLLRCPPMGRSGPAVLTESGAYKALALDMAERLGLVLPEASADKNPALRAAVPDFVPVSNPLDVTAQGLVDNDLYRRAVSAFAGDDRFGSIVISLIHTDLAMSERKLGPVLRALEELRPDKPVIYAGLDEGAVLSQPCIERMRRLGVPCLPSAERALRAVAQVVRAVPGVNSGVVAEPIRVVELTTGMIPEYQAKDLLRPIGIPFPDSRFARRLVEAEAAAAALGYPLVLKAQAAALSHKSDAGGVIVGIADLAALRGAWDALHANIARHRPGLALDGVLVESMGIKGLELIVGGRNDPEWGPVVIVGFGGVQAEISRDFRLMPADLDEEEILAELDALRGAPLLHGYRGSPALDRRAVAGIVMRVGALLRGEGAIREIDLNPVIAYPEGQGAVALDALILVG